MRTQKFIQVLCLGGRPFALTLVASFLCFAQAQSLAKFVGTWRENESKHTFGSAETLSFRLDAKGNLEELRGPDARPLVQPVRFDGKVYSVDASKNTIAWKQTDKNHFERELFVNGQLLTTREIQILDNGKTLTEETTRTLKDGEKQVTTIKFRRTKGEAQGLAGSWQAESYHSTVPKEWKYDMMGDNFMMVEDTGVTFMLTRDGKPADVTGPAVISGYTAALKEIGPDKLEIAESRQGIPTGKLTLTLSGDGKVLTVSDVNLSPNASHEPSVTVFEKQ